MVTLFVTWYAPERYAKLFTSASVDYIIKLQDAIKTNFKPVLSVHLCVYAKTKTLIKNKQTLIRNF